MLRSLYSGVSGMKVNQQKMDVIGNNIANVGTTAFKEGRARFQDMLSQTSRDAMAAMPNTGGINGSQIGLGVQLAGVDTLVTQGMMQPTGNNLDVAIDGDGYFMVGKGPVTVAATNPAITVNQTAGKHTVTKNQNMNISYTRDGSFTLDSDGSLLTSDGYRVLGYSFNGSQAGTVPTGSAASLGGLTFTFGPGSALNGYSIAIAQAGAAPTAAIAGKVITLTADFSSNGAFTLANAQTALNNALKTAGIGQSITIGGAPVTTAGAALGVTDSISGGLGGDPPAASSINGINFDFSDGAALNGYTISITHTAATATPTAVISKAAKTITLDANITAGFAGSSWQSALDTALSGAGLPSITLSGTATAAATGGGPSSIAGGIDDTIVHSLDGSAVAPVVNLVDASQPLEADDGSLKSLIIPDKVLVSGIAGTASAVYSKVKTYSISKEGLITAVLDNSKVAVLGQIATASFKNPAGLTKEGKNLMDQSSNSGEATLRSGVGTAATNEDNSKGYGDIAQGMLEMSNVDLAQEFADMIVTSRAFQASGKMINTGDEMLQDIIGLKR